MLTKEQLQRRSTYVGGSDVASILGVNPYSTPLQVFLEKKGRVKPFEGNNETLAGQIFENTILELYLKICDGAAPLLPLTDDELEFVHPVHPFLVGHPDAIDQDGFILDAKNVGPRMRQVWPSDTADVFRTPVQYRVQILYYMALAKAQGRAIKGGKIVAFFGGSDIRVYTILYEEEAARKILRQVIDFWLFNVVADKEPPATSYRDVAAFLESTPDSTIQADMETRILASLLQEKQQQIRQLENEKEELKEKIALYMGTNEVLLDDQEHTLATFKTYSKNVVNTAKLKQDNLFEYYSEEKPYRVFRLKGE